MTLSPDRAPGPCARALPSVMGGASLTAASFGHPRAGLGIGFEHLIADRALQERQLRLIPAPVHTSHTERRSQEACVTRPVLFRSPLVSAARRGTMALLEEHHEYAQTAGPREIGVCREHRLGPVAGILAEAEISAHRCIEERNRSAPVAVTGLPCTSLTRIGSPLALPPYIPFPYSLGLLEV
jgi:hypothetical protein